MSKASLRLFALIGTILFGASAQAGPIPVDWRFFGFDVGATTEPTYNKIVESGHDVWGYLRFDGSVKAMEPGRWSLTDAEFHMEIDHLTVDASSVEFVADTDGWNWLQIRIAIPEMVVSTPDGPVHVLGGRVNFLFLSYMGSFWELPLAHPRRGEYGMSFDLFGENVPGDYWHGHSSTSTRLKIRTIPEPPPVALYFGLGVILISMRLLRASFASATRRLVAPSPTAATRLEATP